jgi:pimeloyl-ACP methyl ester carboxylesterase
MRDFAGDDEDDWQRRRGAISRLSECRIPESGHMMHLENPARLAREVEPFLAGA